MSRTQRVIDQFFESEITRSDIESLLGISREQADELLTLELTKSPPKFPFPQTCDCGACQTLLSLQTVPESVKTLARRFGVMVADELGSCSTCFPTKLAISYAETVLLYLSIEIKLMIETTRKELSEKL